MVRSTREKTACHVQPIDCHKHDKGEQKMISFFKTTWQWGWERLLPNHAHSYPQEL